MQHRRALRAQCSATLQKSRLGSPICHWLAAPRQLITSPFPYAPASPQPDLHHRPALHWWNALTAKASAAATSVAGLTLATCPGITTNALALHEHLQLDPTTDRGSSHHCYLPWFLVTEPEGPLRIPTATVATVSSLQCSLRTTQVLILWTPVAA